MSTSIFLVALRVREYFLGMVFAHNFWLSLSTHKQNTEMGETAKRRFRMLTAQFNQRVAGATAQNNPPAAGSGGAGGTTGAAAERRGLLDGGDGDSDDGMEMAFGGKKDL
mmetsp:Transcript_35397/g.52666  ORF Transcript_35397/g.52666 Transcript_35397/m.52666 type:complete len:110 (-) Transcript_35397:114-443(-)